MDIQSIIAQMKNSGHDPVRSRMVYSWGDRNTCQRLFIEIFQSVDKTATNFEFLPEYNAIIDWMTNTRGMGLLLTGDCGRGKSTILTGVVPVLLYQATGLVVRPVHSEQFERPCAASWPNAGKEPKNIDYLCNTYFPIIDEIGIEPLINDFGEKYEGFNRVLNIAEQRLKPVFVSTNLTPEQMLARYDVRTIDRLVRLSKMVKFEGKSYRK